jgi:SpoIID/LytB domain protein
MLIPNTIPDKEPILRVGIVLPEDNINQIEIELSESIEYQILSDGQNPYFPQHKILSFAYSSNKIHLNNEIPGNYWRIENIRDYKIISKTGNCVKNVVAGRGFHWQKPIDVYLPGTIEIGSYNNTLILINELPLEEYLMCVATSEMGAECPAALIESQTIAARSWMLANIERKHVDMGMDVCNDDCCQRYQGSGNLTAQSIAGARNTLGQVLLYNNKICDARYSKSCGGIMESFQTIWPDADLEYLKNIPDAAKGFSHRALPLSTEDKVRLWIDDTPATFCSSITIDESVLKKYLGSVDEEGKYFRWQIKYSQEELCHLLNEKLNLSAIAILRFNPVHRGGSGRLSKIEVLFRNDQNQDKSYLIDNEYKIRQSFHKGFLYSSCFYILTQDIKNDIPQKFTLHGAGWGHGVGYCQIGALGMALNGYTTEQIVLHYYPGSSLEKIY